MGRERDINCAEVKGVVEGRGVYCAAGRVVT